MLISDLKINLLFFCEVSPFNFFETDIDENFIKTGNMPGKNLLDLIENINYMQFFQ